MIGVDLKQTTEAVVIGKDLADVQSRWSQVTRVGTGGESWLGPADALMTATEEFEGQIVGVRKGSCTHSGQWRSRPPWDKVACHAAVAIQALFFFSASAPSVLIEPPSWNTPFRNDWSAERLQKSAMLL